MILEDSVSITGMNKSDFERLYTILRDAKEEGYCFGRRDYWDKSLDRLDTWLLYIQTSLEGNDIKIKER